MPMPLTFSGLRGDGRPREWYRRSDLVAAAVALGAPFGAYEVRKAIRHLPAPTERRYGNFCYGPEHLAAVVEAARISLDEAEATGVAYGANGGRLMPLKKGGKKPETIKANVASNIQQLRKDGYPHPQAVAIAMDIAEKAKAKARKK